MKIYSKILGVIFAAGLLIEVAHAQSPGVGTGPELESTGVIADYTDNALVLDIGIGEPVQFKLSSNVVYVDSDGTVLEVIGDVRKAARFGLTARRRARGQSHNEE